MQNNSHSILQNKHYVYKTTNLVNKKIYIGVHSSSNIEQDDYLGSGIHLANAINKHGRENFFRTILFEFNTKSEAYDKEKKLVNKKFVLREDNYNLSAGGNGGWGLGIGKANGFYGKTHSQETKLKMSLKKIGTKASKETKEKFSKIRKGKKFTDKHKAKMSIAARDRPEISEETRNKMSISQKGKNCSKETKAKMRLAHIGKKQIKINCPHCDKIGGPGAMKRWHFDNCKQK